MSVRIPTKSLTGCMQAEHSGRKMVWTQSNISSVTDGLPGCGGNLRKKPPIILKIPPDSLRQRKDHVTYWDFSQNPGMEVF
jgi:hypothetical protein